MIAPEDVMSRQPDDFEGIDINGPWGGIRIGSGGYGAQDWDDDAELRAVRRRVRRRLDFIKNLALFVFIVGGLALADWATGGGWWVHILALIWGAFLLLQFVTTFVAPALWGREAEERMVQREMDRRRGSVHVQNPPRPGSND
jgi:hypothetical protein